MTVDVRVLCGVVASRVEVDVGDKVGSSGVTVAVGEGVGGWVAKRVWVGAGSAHLTISRGRFSRSVANS